MHHNPRLTSLILTLPSGKILSRLARLMQRFDNFAFVSGVLA